MLGNLTITEENPNNFYFDRQKRGDEFALNVYQIRKSKLVLISRVPFDDKGGDYIDIVRHIARELKGDNDFNILHVGSCLAKYLK